MPLSDLLWQAMARMRSWTAAATDIERERSVQIARIGNNLNQLARWANTHTSEAEAVTVIANLVASERLEHEAGPRELIRDYLPAAARTRRGAEPPARLSKVAGAIQIGASAPVAAAQTVTGADAERVQEKRGRPKPPPPSRYGSLPYCVCFGTVL